MGITPEMIQGAVAVFVEHFNDRAFQKACQLYSPYAVLVDGYETCVGREAIINFYKSAPASSIVNYHPGLTLIADDQKQALVVTEFILACTVAGYTEYHQGYSSLLFVLDDKENLFVMADTSLLLKKEQRELLYEVAPQGVHVSP